MKYLSFALSSFGLLAVAGLLAVPGSASTLYTDGPINGAVNGWLINGAHAVADSFTLSQASTVSSVNFGLWVWTSERADYTNGTQTVNWSITSAPDSGTSFGSGTGALSGTLFNGPSGPNTCCNVYSETFSTGSVSLAPGTYWLTLQGATNNSGSVDVYWDENDGPSQAWYDTNTNNGAVGTFITPANYPGACTTPGTSGDCSESFDVNGTSNGGTSGVPEPGSWTLAGSGLLLLAGVVRRKLR